jgi:AraC-like DNA-binding protein
MPSFKTRDTIASEFEISTKTLKRRFEKYGLAPPPGLISPIWQKKIYEEMWYPDGVSKKDYEDYDVIDKDDENIKP